MKILGDTQEHLTILKGGTLPVSTQGGCWTCTTYHHGVLARFENVRGSCASHKCGYTILLKDFHGS